MRYKLTIEIEGQMIGDVLVGIDEIKKAVEAGNLSGCDSCDDGSYEFEIEETN